MGKSFKKNPVKKINGGLKEIYNKQVRSRTKNIIRSLGVEEIDDNIPNPKTLINDYNYHETIIRDEENVKLKRK